MMVGVYQSAIRCVTPGKVREQMYSFKAARFEECMKEDQTYCRNTSKWKLVFRLQKKEKLDKDEP